MATARRKSSRRSRKPRSAESTSRKASAPRTPFALQDSVVESALTTGELSPLLEEYFGAQQYAELRQLARDASTRTVRGGPRVLILPGIMGSKIGKDSKIPLFDDVLWVDPIDVAAGRLTDIALPRGRDLRPLGVILLAYLKLKLQLRAAGMSADFHPFDWRRSIPELGRELKAKLDGMGKDVFLVAHSMGGLVSRSAIAQGASCKRLIMLGTPNFGSFAPVMALRATYPVVRKIGWLDTKHTPEQLCRDVFATFPGLTQMLPFRERWDGLDLFDLANWPGTEGLAPRKEILDATPAVQKSLSPGRDNFFLIAGVDQETAVSAALETKDGKTEFVFELSQEGDGTVPLEFCRLPDIGGTWFVKEGHGGLPNNGTVGRAVIDIIEKGTTNALPDQWSPPDRRGARRATESQLRAVEPYAGRRSGLLSQGETRMLLQEVASPVSSESAAAAPPAVPPAGAGPPVIGPGYQHAFEHVVVGRRRQHRIELRFALGSITEADARAIALGAFSDVTPSGAASALDARVGGAITELFRRRMFAARIGEVFVLPRGRHALAAEFITFVGLGSFDRFNDQALQTAAENVIRTFINARIEEFATVLFGGGSGENPAGALQNLLTGFFRGLKDADHDHRFRRITVCEQNPERYTTLKAELFRLSSTSLGEDVEMTFDEQVLPEAPAVAAPAARRVRREDPVYLIVRQERSGRGTVDIRSSLLTAGSKATIITGVSTPSTAALDAVRSRIIDGPGSGFAAAGTELAQLVLPEDIRVVLPRFSDRHLVVVHDAPMSRVPWEVLAFPATKGGVWFPSIQKGLTHRYAADNLSVAKWLEERVQDGVLNILLVVNPTLDLAGAEKEGKRIRQLFAGQPGVKLREVHGRDATHRTLLAAFSSGEYDVIHYAGHAFFDEDSPEQSGLLCHQHVPLTGSELSALGKLPALVFFNACEAGRVRGAAGGRASKRQQTQAQVRKLQRAVGFAEAFMRGGVANFLGTYWEVGDDAALEFAQTFYRELVAGRTLGDALQGGRTAVRAVDDRDWADYLFYGSPDFVLKEVH
jgi:pimeloyl-ACP methyl ester carboxylesterase